MNKRQGVMLVLVAGAILALLWLLRPRSTTSLPQAAQGQARSNDASGLAVHTQAQPPGPEAQTTTPTQEHREILVQNETKRRAMTNEALLWRTPLIYFGRVVDESNRPILGVLVSFNTSSVNENLTEERYDNGTVRTDARGIFKIDGVRGIGMVFELSHPNYYSYPDNATGFDIRSRPRNGIIPDNEAAAMLFRMHTKGRPVPLIKRGGGLHKPADGTVMDFPLRGKTRAQVIGQLQIQGWKAAPDSRSGHYDWRVRIAPLAGGILECTNYFDFVAPEAGYEQALEISAAEDDPNWRSSTRRTFFLKLPGYFARGQAYIDLHHDLFFSMDYLVNPDGSTNLEDDLNHPFQEP